MAIYRVSLREGGVLYDASDGAVMAVLVDAVDEDHAVDVLMEFGDVPSYVQLKAVPA